MAPKEAEPKASVRLIGGRSSNLELKRRELAGTSRVHQPEAASRRSGCPTGPGQVDTLDAIHALINHRLFAVQSAAFTKKLLEYPMRPTQLSGALAVR